MELSLILVISIGTAKSENKIENPNREVGFDTKPEEAWQFVSRKRKWDK
jgi:hypothetical protein